MRHENSVFHSLTKHIPWPVFDRLVRDHRADFRVRRLDTRSQFLALLFGQLAGAASLREIEAGLASHQARLYHLGARRPARSTLADANAARPWPLFADLFAHMAGRAGRTTRRRMAPATRILDATTVRLSGLSAGWARFSAHHCAAKLHLVYDPDARMPLSAVVTPDSVNDITPAKATRIEAGATYVFDLAYYDYGWWARLDAAGCRIVTRLKRNTPLAVVAELPVAEGSAVLSDRIGNLPRRQARNRANPFQGPVREIAVRTPKGKLLRLATNDLDAPAEQIAELYKQRWQIELFFKWIKQNLRIRHFLGTSENAVRIQLFVALIAYLLIRSAQTAQTAVKQPLAFARLIRLNLMHRRTITALDQPYQPPPPDSRQINLPLQPA
jgi:hypothetical protein